MLSRFRITAISRTLDTKMSSWHPRFGLTRIAVMPVHYQYRRYQVLGLFIAQLRNNFSIIVSTEQEPRELGVKTLYKLKISDGGASDPKETSGAC